ncbi:MAG: heme-copper oxidase subunit III [Synechococcus sp. SupBloom_Metag_053]|jgi:cytochrome c oxidase subunit 3|nr:heme-copper oxidase subunit III [Synechococcus sp. SupBloom_Metag_053]
MESTTANNEGHGMHASHNLTGFIIFLCSESVIFIAFFSGFALLKLNALDWLPNGVAGLEWQTPLINTFVLVSSSGTIYLAERQMVRQNIWGFRGWWLATMALGGYFLWGQAVEWSGLQFGFTSGTFGGTFYLLTGFHGLHVLTGVLLMLLMLVKSFIPNNYKGGEQGIQATSLFWHFVDVIWIILFLLIYVWQRS